MINVKVLSGCHLTLSKKIIHHQKENRKPTSPASELVVAATQGDGV